MRSQLYRIFTCIFLQVLLKRTRLYAMLKDHTRLSLSTQLFYVQRAKKLSVVETIIEKSACVSIEVIVFLLNDVSICRVRIFFGDACLFQPNINII